MGGYVRVKNGLIQVRYSAFDNWPTIGTAGYDRQFAKKVAAEIKRLAEEMIYPDHWPPQEGDVWKNVTGAEYFVSGGKVYSSGYSQPLSNLTSAIENGAAYTLVHRKGNVLK